VTAICPAIWGEGVVIMTTRLAMGSWGVARRRGRPESVMRSGYIPIQSIGVHLVDRADHGFEF